MDTKQIVFVALIVVAVVVIVARNWQSIVSLFNHKKDK